MPHPVWDAETILRFANRGEDIFAVENNVIIERIALDIVSGTSQYTLPDYVYNVRKVLWKGYRLDPISHRDYRDGFIIPPILGLPREYIYNNIGKQIIQLVPTPNETVTSVLTGLYGTEIPARVIVEYYRLPDHVDVMIPTYIRRRLLKCYVAKMCFAIEGRGQNLKASKYFDEKWKFLQGFYAEILEDLVTKPRRLVSDYEYDPNYVTPFAHLNPNQFGIGVDY